MNDDTIKNQIEGVVAASPSATEQNASKPIEAPQQPVGYSTLRVGLPDQMQEAPAQQYATTPEQGILIGPNTDEMITGGTAIPGLKYDTRFKTAAEGGDPLYFKPNYQPVIPYPINGVEADTLNKYKFEWSQAKARYGARDEDYVGYYYAPEPGSLYWWDHFMGNTMAMIESTPATVLKGGTNLGGSAAKVLLSSPFGLPMQLTGLLNRVMTEAPESDTGSLLNAMNETTSGYVSAINSLQDIVSEAVEPLEKHAFNTWSADLTDDSFKAKSARAISSGVYSLGLALATNNPSLAFAILNFAETNNMRRNALNYGASPLWSEVYSVGGSSLNTVLDLFGFEALVNSSSLVKIGSKKFYEYLGKKGLLVGVKKHAPREIAATGMEMGTEPAQEFIEGAYDPEYRASPLEASLLAVMGAGALKIALLPISIRNANFDDRMKLAERAGVVNILNDANKAADDVVDKMIKAGVIDESRRAEVREEFMRAAPDYIIKTIREGAMGALDKIPPEVRKNFMQTLKDAQRNFQGKIFSPETFAKLDSEVDTALSGIRNGISDAEVEMIKGLVRGAYVNAAIANANNPNYKGFQVPTFVVAKNKNGYSYYDSNKNEIGIHESRSSTEYTNNSPQYAGRLQDSFVPSSRQSDKIASLIHEMSHWMDHVVGEKGFGDFLEHYYNSIATAFGNDTARRLYNEREGKGKERPSEYFAQTMGRMGKRSAEAFGLGKSQANKFLSYANIAMNQLANLEGSNGEKLSQSIADFQTMLQEATKANMGILSELIEVYGKDNIKQALANFNKDSEGYGDFAEYLANKDMLQELFNVMDGFADAAGIDKINDLFQGDQKAMDNFVTMGDKMFREGYDKAVDEVRQRRAEAKKTAPKPVEAKTDLDLVRTAIGIVDTTTDSSQVHEDGVQYEFGGVNAALPITQQLEQAQAMMIAKASPQEIFKETGWFFDSKDKKWKFEIPSGTIETTKLEAHTTSENGNKNIKKFGYLSDFYKNDKLYEAYPDLKDVSVMFAPAQNGEESGNYTYRKGDFSIEVQYNPEDIQESAENVLVHEVQHIIQDIEGFARGGSAREFMDIGAIRSVYKNKGQEAGAVVLSEELNKAWPKYQALGGEIEARNVQLRRKGSKMLPGVGNTTDTVPTMTQDIPNSKAIIKFNNTDIAKYIPSQNVDYEDGVWYERSVGYRGTSNENESPDVMKNKYSARGAGIYYTNDKEQAKFYWFKRAWDEGKIKVEMEVMTKDGSVTKKFDITNNRDYNADFEEIVEGAGPQEERRLFFDDWFDLLEDDGSVKTIYPRPVRTAIENLRDKIAYDMGVKPEDILYMSTNVKGDFGKIVKSLLPDDEHMLNDEINLADQSEYVRNAMEKIRPLYEDMVRAYRPDDYDWYMKAFESDGQDIVYRLANIFDAYREATGDFRNSPEKAATQLLSRVGIEGLKLHDGDTIVFTPEALDKIEEYTDRHEIEFLEEGGIQYETQDWAKAALAKDSVKQSFEAGKQEKKQIAADTKIDGRDLTDDIDMANQGLMQRLKDPMNKLVKWASSSPWGWGLDRILVTLIGRGAAEKLDVAGKYAAKQNIRSRYWDEFMARLKPLFGDPKTNTEFMYKYKTMVNNLGFVRMTGLEMTDPVNPAITFTRDITGWEAMYVYLMKEQGFGDRVQRSTTTKIDDIIATLSDDEKAFALHMSDQLMGMYEKTFGKSKYAHYFPILDAEHELFDELSIDSLMSRQDTDDAIAITDAGRIFSQYISRWASHESNYFQTMKRVRDIFRYTGVDKNEMGPMYTFDLEQDEARKRASAQVAAAVRQAIGDDGYRNLMNLVESELQDGQEQMFDASRNKTLTQMGSNIIKSILSNKMVSFPKNVANMFMFWGGAKDQGRYWNSFAEGIGNYRDTFKYMMEHSPEIKQRWGAAGGINEYLDQRTLGGSTAPVMKGISKVFAKMDWTGDKTQNMAKFSAVMEMLGDAGLKVFMQSGDMIANVYGGYGLVKDYMAQGMSEADAFRKLDRYIIEHQSSSNLTMKPLVQKLQNKSLLGQVFAFTSEGVAKWASILGTFDEVKMGTATKSEAMANVVSIAISMALYSLIAAGAWDLLDDDEKVQEETVKALGDTLLDQVFGGMVAGNAFITPVVSYLVGDSRVSGMSVPIYNFALDGIAALKKGDYDRVLTKAMSALGVPVGADNAWTTLLGISMANDPNPDVRYAARLMLAGYTPSRSAKRAGIKKETLEKNSEE